VFFCTVRSTPHQSIFWHWLIFYSPCRTLFKLVIFFWWVLSCDARHCIEVQWSAMNAWEKNVIFFLQKRKEEEEEEKKSFYQRPKTGKRKEEDTHTQESLSPLPSFFPLCNYPTVLCRGVRDELARGVCQKRGGNLTPPIHVRLCGSTIRWATNSTSLKSNNQGNLGSEWSLPIFKWLYFFSFF